jgi:hypothetical protein
MPSSAGPERRRASCEQPGLIETAKRGLQMNSEPNSYVSQKAPQWMRDMFEELEELFLDTDKLNLEEMQQRLDEFEQPIVAASEQPSASGSARLLSRLP